MKKAITLLLALCVILACTAGLAEDKVYQIGVLQLVQHNALDAATNGFVDTLKNLLGDKVNFDIQNAQGDVQNCASIASGFTGYDLIMANATPALQACMNVTSTIPILGTSVTDYATAIGDESMDASAGTGINVSGASDGVNAQLYVDVLKDLLPDAKKVSILYCIAEPNSVVQSASFIAALPEGVAATEFTFNDSTDLQSVVAAAIEDCDALYIPTDNTAAANMGIINNVCEPAKVPVICGEENMMANGGLVTVSISYYDIGALAGQQAYDILVNGADVSALPIAYSANPIKEYNADYAEAIGFAIPDGYTAYEAAE